MVRAGLKVSRTGPRTRICAGLLQGTGPLAPSRGTPHPGLCSGEGGREVGSKGGTPPLGQETARPHGGTCPEPWETELGEQRHRYLEEGMLKAVFLAPSTARGHEVVRPPAADREKVKPCSARVLPLGPRPAESSRLLMPRGQT